MEIGIMLVFELIALSMNTTTQKVQEAYERSDAFRKYFDQLYNTLNEEYQSKLQDSTPTSSASLNQRNFLQSLINQRYGRDLLQLRKEFDKIEARYDAFNAGIDKDPTLRWDKKSVIDQNTKKESIEKSLAAEKLKQEGKNMKKLADTAEVYLRRPNSYNRLAAQSKQGKETKNA